MAWKTRRRCPPRRTTGLDSHEPIGTVDARHAITAIPLSPSLQEANGIRQHCRAQPSALVRSLNPALRAERILREREFRNRQNPLGTNLGPHVPRGPERPARSRTISEPRLKGIHGFRSQNVRSTIPGGQGDAPVIRFVGLLLAAAAVGIAAPRGP